MDAKALQLLSAFSYSPNKLGYCGLESANSIFTKCLTVADCSGVPEALHNFKGLMPYLQTIAEVTGLDPLDFQVAQAYWLGNDLLKQFKPQHYSILIKHLKNQQLPDFFIHDIEAKTPKAFIPLHLFNVIHIGVGQITGSVEFNLENINNCIIRWGRVETMNQKESTAAVYTIHLQPTPSNTYQITKTEDIIPYLTDLTPNLKPNDMVAIHWNQITATLEEPEQETLAHWTKTLLNSL